MAPNANFSKIWKKRPIGGQDTIMGNYRIPKKKSTVAEEERKRQRLRDTRNLATGIEIALRNLLPDDSALVKRAVWNAHDSLAIDIELGVDSHRTDFLGARIVDSATPKGQARENARVGHGRLNNSGRNSQGVPLAPRSMIKYWSVLDEGLPDHPYQREPPASNRSISFPRTLFSEREPASNSGECFSETSSRSTYPYRQDPTDPNRLIGVPRPRLPSWATRPNYRKSPFEKPARTSYPYLQDPSDPNKFVGVPRPFDGKDQSTKTDKYTGPAFHENRRRQIELGLLPDIYPDYWISGETFGDDDKDIFSAKRLYEKEQEDIKGDAGAGPSAGLDRDGDVVMSQGPGTPTPATQEAETPMPPAVSVSPATEQAETPIPTPASALPTTQEEESLMPTPVSVSSTPVNSVYGSLVRVLDGFRIEDEVVLDTPETVKARQDFFTVLESDVALAGSVDAPAASEGRSNNGLTSSLVDLDDSKVSDTASTSRFGRIGAGSSRNARLAARKQKMKPYRTSSVVCSSYAPTASSGASDIDGPSHKSGSGTPSHRAFGRYASSSRSRTCTFETMLDSALAHAIDIPVLEPTPAPKSSLFAGHASNLRAPMSHSEKVNQWAASIAPSGNTNSQPISPNKAGSAGRAPVEFTSPRSEASRGKAVTPTSRPNRVLSNDLFELAGGGNGDIHAPPRGGKP